MHRVRATLWGSLVFIFLMISVGSSPILADERGERAGKRFFDQAQQGHRGMGSEAPWISIMLRHRDQLNLTGEQVATLEQMRSGFEQQVVPTQENLRNAESEIARLLQENTVDLAQVRAKIEEAGKFRAEFRYLRIETLEKGKAVLTAEQRDKLNNLTSSSHGRFQRPQGETS